MRVGSGTGGLVGRLHWPTWSLVFRVSPVPYPVLVCTDELSGHAWRIDQDRDWKPEIEHTMMAVVGQLSRYASAETATSLHRCRAARTRTFRPLSASRRLGSMLRRVVAGGLRGQVRLYASWLQPWRLLVA